MATRTGCWLYIGAQHITAQHGVVHYTSPRLCADAPQEIEDFANDFDGLVDDLRQARKDDAVKLRRRLGAVEKEKQQLADQLQAAKRRKLEQARYIQQLESQPKV